ncbi:MAG: bifunctional chorismate mutase/prephenate dehydratase [Vicinamibacterales bacterium]
MTDEQLELLRAELDQLDDDLVDLLARRQEAVKRVAAVKARTSAPLRDVLRETRQIARLAERARGRSLDEMFVARIFREIVDFSVRTQEMQLGMSSALDQPRPITVVFQGADGAFSHIAARRFFAPRPSAVTYLGRPSFRSMLEEVRSGAADYAMLPIENTTSGSVHDAYDALSHTDLAIVGEEVLRIELCLVGVAEVPLESLLKVYSHPQALSQSTAFLASLPQCTVETFIDTAMSVERVKDEADPTHAAIASAEAAVLHGLHILRRDIANHRENYTRFLVIARESEPRDPRVPCKTSVMFVTAHERGALLACLNVLAAHGLNLTKLESRPRPGRPFEYLFYVEFEGNTADAPVQRALDEISALTKSLKIFGSFPARTGAMSAAPAS